MVEAQGPDEVTLGTLHQDLSVLKEDLSVVKQDLSVIKQDLSALRSETREGFAALMDVAHETRRELGETRGELAGILREMASGLREMITIQRLVLDELRGVNTRLDRFALGRGDGAPPI